ncbi:MAG: twin-arginine translocase subunit TatC [Vicinamibacterales bacterium]
MALAPVPQHPAPPTEDDQDLDDLGGKMSFLEHLDELRKRLIVSVSSLLIGFVVGLVFIDRIFAFIMRPLQAVVPNGGKLIYTEPTEAFMLYMKIAALVGLFLAAPVILYQLWLFVAPGLYAHEKRLAIPFVFFSTIFFLLGAAFSHFVVFPWAWQFFAQFTTDYMQFTPRIAPTFSLYVRMLLGLGAVFEMPTLVLFLARIGVVTPRLLWRNFKYAILIIFIVAAIITPDPNPVSQVLVAGPMVALYLFSIAVAWIFGKKKAASSAEAS